MAQNRAKLLHPVERFLEQVEVRWVAELLTRRSHTSAFSRASLVHVAPLPAGSIHGSARSK